MLHVGAPTSCFSEGRDVIWPAWGRDEGGRPSLSPSHGVTEVVGLGKASSPASAICGWKGATLSPPLPLAILTRRAGSHWSFIDALSSFDDVRAQHLLPPFHSANAETYRYPAQLIHLCLDVTGSGPPHHINLLLNRSTLPRTPACHALTNQHRVACICSRSA